MSKEFPQFSPEKTEVEAAVPGTEVVAHGTFASNIVRLSRSNRTAKEAMIPALLAKGLSLDEVHSLLHIGAH